MDGFEALRQDHALLRQKLLLLESALNVAPDARFALRDMCFSLQRSLHEHVEREARVLKSTLIAQSSKQESTKGHASVVRTLNMANRLLLGDTTSPISEITLRLHQAVNELHRQMQAQEQTLFASLAHRKRSSRPKVSVPISGAMSMNEVLARYPQTAPFFRQAGISRTWEGHECLDELAWRHGLGVTQLIGQLQHAADAAAKRPVVSTTS